MFLHCFKRGTNRKPSKIWGERMQFQGDLRDALMKFNLAQKIEYVTALDSFPNNSLWLLLLRKIRSGLLFSLVTILPPYGRGRALKVLRNLKNSKIGHVALVIGNGRSQSCLDTQIAVDLQTRGELTIFATNLFLHSELSKEIKPDFLVWSDTDLLPELSSDKPAAIERLNRSSGLTLIVPWRWSRFSSIISRQGTNIFFNDDTRLGWGSSWSPVKARSYASNVGPKAISIARFLGFTKIYVIGIDQDYFMDYRVSQDGRLWKTSAVMAPGTAQFPSWEIGPFPHGIITRLSRDLYGMWDLYRFFRDDRIENLDVNSILFFWKKADKGHHLLKTNASNYARWDKEDGLE